jgi:ferredoxin
MNQQLRVNPTACTGHGLCAELLPERVTLDEWGYPVISSEPVPAQLARAARRAVPAASHWPCCSVTTSGPGKQPGGWKRPSGAMASRRPHPARPRPGSRHGPVTAWRSRRPRYPGRSGETPGYAARRSQAGKFPRQAVAANSRAS